MEHETGAEAGSQMLRVNETVTGYDLGELLHGEAGLFEAIAPEATSFNASQEPGIA